MNEADISIVADPAEVADLVTIDTLKTIDALAALADADLEKLRQKAEAHVLRILNYPLAEDQPIARSVARNEYIDSYFKSRALHSLRLSRSPVQVTAVKVDEGGTFVTVDPNDYQVRGGAGLVFKCSGAFNAGVMVMVEYLGGWVTPAQLAATPALAGPRLPPDINSAVADIAQLLHARAARDNVLIRTEADTAEDLGALQTSWGDGAGLERQIEARLAPFSYLAS